MFPNVVVGGTCGFAIAAWAGAVKPLLFEPPPSDKLVPVLLLMGMAFLVVALTVWVFTPTFRAIRKQTGDIDTRSSLPLLPWLRSCVSYGCCPNLVRRLWLRGETLRRGLDACGPRSER